MNRCARCIMPETAEGIKFSPRGHCQLCENYREYVPKGETALVEAVRKFKDSPGECNCVVPVSGGRDSAYALYYAKRVLGLRPLAVHNDNDFETDIAVRNLDAMSKRLDVPLVRTRSKSNVARKIVAEKFMVNAPFGPGIIVAQTCEACKYGFEAGSYATARARGIALVIWGDSNDESTTPYYGLAGHKAPSKWQKYFSPAFLNLLKYRLLFSRMKKEYGTDSPRGLTEIHLYSYIRWDRAVIVDTIKEHLGWSAPQDSPTSWRVDCKLVPVVNYLTERAYGVSKLEIGFSNMVRSGKMDREEAIRQIEQVKKNTDVGQLKQFMREIGVSDRAINRVM